MTYVYAAHDCVCTVIIIPYVSLFTSLSPSCRCQIRFKVTFTGVLDISVLDQKTQKMWFNVLNPLFCRLAIDLLNSLCWQIESDGSFVELKAYRDKAAFDGDDGVGPCVGCSTWIHYRRRPLNASLSPLNASLSMQSPSLTSIFRR